MWYSLQSWTLTQYLEDYLQSKQSPTRTGPETCQFYVSANPVSFPSSYIETDFNWEGLFLDTDFLKLR